MKKNYNLFKAIVICFLVFVVLSWLIPVGSLTEGTFEATTIKPVGLFGLVYYPLLSITTFIQFGVVALAIGAFYGVLNKTGVYTKLVNNVVKKFKKREKLFLIYTITSLVLLSSFIGIPYAFLVFVPLLFGILLSLGFNKMTTLAATIGSMLVGTVASTYGYGVGTQIAQIFSINLNDDIIFKLAFLVIVLFLYLLFVIGNEESKLIELTKKITKKKETKEETKKTTSKKVATTKKAKPEVEVIEVQEKVVIPFVEEEITSTKSTKPLVIMLVFLAFVLMITMINWKYMFNIELFANFHESLKEITIGEVPVISSILGFNNAFGQWTSIEMSVVLLAFSFLIGWIYNLKFDEVLEGIIKGGKRMLKPAFLMTIASVVFTMMLVGGQSNLFITIANKLNSITEGFNFFFTSITGLLSGFFYNDFYYALNSVAGIYTTNFDAEFLPIAGFIFQTMHSIMMLIIPTSIVLISGLSLLDMNFKDWIKYIFKFALQLIAISLIVAVILVLLV